MLLKYCAKSLTISIVINILATYPESLLPTPITSAHEHCKVSVFTYGDHISVTYYKSTSMLCVIYPCKILEKSFIGIYIARYVGIYNYNQFGLISGCS